MRERDRPPAWGRQREEQLGALVRAIRTICGAWDDASAAAAAHGYPSSSPGPRAAAGLGGHPKDDPLYASTIYASPDRTGDVADPTMSRALRGADASRWRRDVAVAVTKLLRMSSADAPGERRWTSAFYPPALLQTLLRAAQDVVDLWPDGTDRLISQLVRLANVARREWPETPEDGTVVETEYGKVVVGRRADTLAETCVGCGKQIDLGEPVHRLTGEPYHGTTCYYREYRRRRRANERTGA